MSEFILGISAYYHDSAAALLKDGDIFAAAQEERFTRKKHDYSFPRNAVTYVLDEAGVSIDRLSAIAFYDKPYLKFERLLETYHGFAPKGLKSYLSAMPVWIKEKLFTRKLLKDEIKKLNRGRVKKILFPEHHLSHAASAFFPSPFKEASIITIDGVGEWATTTICYGCDNDIRILRQLDFPHSLGLLYSAFTYYCGFKVNSGEYKLMGLSPYGNPEAKQTVQFINKIKEEIIDIRDDGSFLLNMDYFDYATGLTMCNNRKWLQLFELPKRLPETELSQPYMNMALAIQKVSEEIILRISKTAKEITNGEHLVMAGGVALNCVANEKLLNSRIFKDVWIQPAAGDAGGALGAALVAWHMWKGKRRTVDSNPDAMKGAYLGPQFSRLDIRRVANKFGAVYNEYESFEKLVDDTAEILSEGNVVGWFQGRMEYGPRALGNRSIIGDPRKADMQKKLNLKIKYREGFRPFAPSVLEEDIDEYFNLKKPSPYMLLVSPVLEKRRKQIPPEEKNLSLLERLYYLRSDIPAVTHIDYSARIQSVNRKTNKKYWELINAFKNKTGYGLVVNTSFNVRGEPIVCTPENAYICFMRTEMDFLVIENFLFNKSEQPKLPNDSEWRVEYELD